MKKQSKKSKMLKSIGLFLVRLLYCCIEGWMYFGFNWISETKLGINVSALIVFIALALAMGALETVMVHKRLNDETVNKKVLVVKKCCDSIFTHTFVLSYILYNISST